MEENICDLIDDLNFYRAKQAILIAAKNEFNRLNSEYNDDVNKMSYFDDILADTIQRLEYECAEVHTSIVQLTLTKK